MTNRTLAARLGHLESRRRPAAPIRSKAERDAVVAAFLADLDPIDDHHDERAIGPRDGAVLAVARRADT